ncbi:MAG: Rho termination factor [Pseudomonadota bacterium]
MAGTRASVKDEKTYRALRDDGASKEKAARIANARAAGDAPGKAGGKAPPYEARTRDRLYDDAKRIGIKGRSRMTKAELIEALRRR